MNLFIKDNISCNYPALNTSVQIVLKKYSSYVSVLRSELFPLNDQMNKAKNYHRHVICHNLSHAGNFTLHTEMSDRELYINQILV